MIPSPSPRLVEAIARAAAQAQDRRAAMQRIPAGIVIRRLRAQALDCALSPLAHDQLLALVLEGLADGDHPGPSGQRLAALKTPVADAEAPEPARMMPFRQPDVPAWPFEDPAPLAAA